MTFGDDGYFFVSRSNGDILENPLLSEIEGQGKFKPYGDEVALLSKALSEGNENFGELIQYSWAKPSTQVNAEKIGLAVYLEKWDWVIGSGLYTDDIAAQIGQIQSIIERYILVYADTSSLLDRCLRENANREHCRD